MEGWYLVTDPTGKESVREVKDGYTKSYSSKSKVKDLKALGYTFEEVVVITIEELDSMLEEAKDSAYQKGLGDGNN